MDRFEELAKEEMRRLCQIAQRREADKDSIRRYEDRVIKADEEYEAVLESMLALAGHANMDFGTLEITADQWGVSTGDRKLARQVVLDVVDRTA